MITNKNAVSLNKFYTKAETINICYNAIKKIFKNRKKRFNNRT